MCMALCIRLSFCSTHIPLARAGVVSIQGDSPDVKVLLGHVKKSIVWMAIEASVVIGVLLDGFSDATRL